MSFCLPETWEKEGSEGTDLTPGGVTHTHTARSQGEPEQEEDGPNDGGTTGDPKAIYFSSHPGPTEWKITWWVHLTAAEAGTRA